MGCHGQWIVRRGSFTSTYFRLKILFENGDWAAVDDVVQDLFTDRVLVVDVEKRITAQDALAHAWISPLMERSSTVTSRDHPAVTGSWFPSDLILPKNDLM